MKNTGCRCEHNTKVSFSFSPSCFHAFSWFSSSTSVGDVDRVEAKSGRSFYISLDCTFDSVNLTSTLSPMPPSTER